MGLPSSKLTSSSVKHQLITAVAATGIPLSNVTTIQTSNDSKPSLADLKANSSTQSKESSTDLNDDKNESSKKTVTITTTTTSTTKIRPYPPLQKQQSSSSGDFPSIPDSKKVPPKPPKRSLPSEQQSTARKPMQKQHLSKTSSGRTFEKQQTINEGGSPPL